MADAWEILISKSTLSPASSYDAWEHLNAQAGGGGGDTIIYGDGVLIMVEDNQMDVELEPEAEIQVALDDVEVGLENEIEIEIDEGEVGT